jgi:hypothetical protein
MSVRFSSSLIGAQPSVSICRKQMNQQGRGRGGRVWIRSWTATQSRNRCKRAGRLARKRPIVAPLPAGKVSQGVETGRTTLTRAARSYAASRNSLPLSCLPRRRQSLPPPDKLLWPGEEWLHPHEDRFGLQRDESAGSRKIRAGDGKRAGKGNGRDAADFKRMKLDGKMLSYSLVASQPWSGCG